MSIRDTGTEQLIRQTTRKIFFAKGGLHATTKNIADAACICRTSLHYYYKSRDELMKQVFNEATCDLNNKLYSLMDAKLPFRKKVEKPVAVFLSKAFLKEIEKEMEAGNITKMELEHFMMNLIAPTLHPLLLKPLHAALFNLSGTQYNKLMIERKN